MSEEGPGAGLAQRVDTQVGGQGGNAVSVLPAGQMLVGLEEPPQLCIVVENVLQGFLIQAPSRLSRQQPAAHLLQQALQSGRQVDRSVLVYPGSHLAVHQPAEHAPHRELQPTQGALPRGERLHSAHVVEGQRPHPGGHAGLRQRPGQGELGRALDLQLGALGALEAQPLGFPGDSKQGSAQAGGELAEEAGGGAGRRDALLDQGTRLALPHHAHHLLLAPGHVVHRRQLGAQIQPLQALGLALVAAVVAAAAVLAEAHVSWDGPQAATLTGGRVQAGGGQGQDRGPAGPCHPSIARVQS